MAGLIWVLEAVVGVPNASATFLLAVVAAASLFGTADAIVAAVGAFLIYDVFFTEPRFTLAVSDPGEWLNLLLLLLVGVVVGRLAAAQRTRTLAAVAREREAQALFRMSRVLATRSGTTAVLPELAAIARVESGMDRIRIALAAGGGRERTATDTAGHGEWLPPAGHFVLRRMPGDVPAEWVHVHQPAPAVAGSGASTTRRPGAGATAHPAREAGEPAAGDTQTYRVVIEAGEHRLGSIWAVRPRQAGRPDQTATRVLAAIADQIGQALEQDRLAREARDAEIARRSDALKTALLESVSHDLRTPLASIRAAAGTLLDRDVPVDRDEQEATALAIDREAEHLNRLVTNLLDLSRIEAGELKAILEPFEIGELIDRALERLAVRLEGRRVELSVAPALPPVLADEVFVDQVLTNVVENAINHTTDGARIRIRAGPAGDPDATTGDGTDRLRLTIEDDGPGVPDDALERLFDKFYRVRRRGEPSRPGSGIGLTVVRGLIGAMGGAVRARRSDLGGLAIDIDLATGEPPAPTDDEPVLSQATAR